MSDDAFRLVTLGVEICRIGSDGTVTVDFERVALELHNLTAAMPRSVGVKEIAEWLRRTWNARGTIDEDAMLKEFGGPTPEALRAAGAIRIQDR